MRTNKKPSDTGYPTEVATVAKMRAQPARLRRAGALVTPDIMAVREVRPGPLIQCQFDIACPQT